MGAECRVYRKDRLPVVLDDSEVDLRYAAAANPDDPVGGGSVNTTSQNWPLGADIRQAAPLDGAAIQKTDVWESAGDPSAYTTFMGVNNYGALPDPANGLLPDQGFPLAPDPQVFAFWPNAAANGALPGVAGAQGSRMPGFGQPYAVNAPQAFSAYQADAKTWQGRLIPATDIDDQGRVNPYPLMRVSVVDKATGAALAATDAVLDAGRDLHCRECHAKGGIAADPATPWTAEAWHYSAPDWAGNFGGVAEWWEGGATSFQPPVFFESVDRQGQASANLFDQEYAAVKNTASIHDFYDNLGLVHAQERGGGVAFCFGCHRSRITGWALGGIDQNPNEEGLSLGLSPNQAGPLNAKHYFNPDYSRSMHQWHGQLQHNPAKNGLLRGANGVPLRWNPADGPNPNSLFPVLDAEGKPLPMEQNCLRCHAGHREPLYRDRMATAGVTCFQCHGDMLAVGKQYPKPQPNPDGLRFRTDWYDQPDCGSCHVGSGNQGKGDPLFYSEGVMNLAFEASDRSATPRPVDLDNPDASRFAVRPYTQLEFPSTYFAMPTDGSPVSSGGGSRIETIRTRLYQNGRDRHGDVPCAACHGGAHQVWPNRDPKANDNLAAVQLQGHTGTIHECNVCHTADAFRLQGDLDGGTYSGDAKAGILGGPHNLHPVNDAYWWKSSLGDAANQDGTEYGGWHNNYAKKPGKDGEDQCAACHGNDHKGTRLSKTPVDRVFDFSDMDFAKLQAAGFKSKVVKVAAGEQIGCDTCHSIETSCIGSPAGSACGIASAHATPSTNRPPVFDLLPTSTGLIGQPNRYTVHATDPDGDPVTYSVSGRPDDMAIDPVSGVITTQWPGSLFYWPWDPKNSDPALDFSYIVTAADAKGGYATQAVKVSLACPAPYAWSGTGCFNTSVGGVKITSMASVKGLSVGEGYRYEASAASAQGLDLKFSLVDAPAGMSVGRKTGVVAWTPASGGTFNFLLRASDGQGGSATQAISLTVCAPPESWHEDHGMCM